METIGETLRAARHAKQLALEDVARTTKIKLDILEKLEADEFDRLVSPTYAKGFLKLYAEHLGLDAPALVAIYLKSQGGLRRQGLQVETTAAARGRKPGELRLPVRRVAFGVAVLTLLAVVAVTALSLWERGQQRRAAAPPPVARELPALESTLYYTPARVPAPSTLE